jgi:hypothetical protein
MPLLRNGIIERWIILDYSILVIYPPSATSAKNKRVFFTKRLRKKFFFAQRAKQAWLRCYYHSIGLCESRQWHMQLIFCLTKAHETF